AGILVFIFSWNELLYALSFISTPAKRTVPVAIALFAGEHVEPWGQIAAASVLATLPLAALVFFLQRRIVAGLTAAAGKDWAWPASRSTGFSSPCPGPTSSATCRSKS